MHKIINVEQKLWLKSYINFNTNERKKAIFSFEKDFFKLLNNSVCGKTIGGISASSTIVSKKVLSPPGKFRLFTEKVKLLVPLGSEAPSRLLSQRLQVLEMDRKSVLLTKFWWWYSAYIRFSRYIIRTIFIHQLRHRYPSCT